MVSIQCGRQAPKCGKFGWQRGKSGWKGEIRVREKEMKEKKKDLTKSAGTSINPHLHVVVIRFKLAKLRSLDAIRIIFSVKAFFIITMKKV